MSPGPPVDIAAAGARLPGVCGRYAITSPNEALEQLFRADTARLQMPPRYNAAPGQDLPVVRFDPERKRRVISALRWGLVPHWADDPKIAWKLINARSETAERLPAFRAAFARRRCLVPANAFYEWRKEGKQRLPHAIARRDGGMMALAGLWEGWKQPDGAWLRSFTILTVPANAALHEIHPRMPAILPPAD